MKRPKQTHIPALTLLLAGSLLFSPAGVSAQDSNLDPAHQQLEQARQQKDFYSRQQNDLVQQAGSSAADLQTIEADLAKHRGVVAKSTARLNQINDRLTKLKHQRGQAMEQSYVTGRDVNYLFALFDSASLSDFLSKSQYTFFLLHKKDSLIESVDLTIKDLNQERRDLVTKQNAYESDIAGLEKKLADLRAALEQNKTSLAAAQQLESYLGQLTDNQNQNDRDFTKHNEPIGDHYTFTGGGTEHGLGMSQYGAKGAADHGFDYRKILSHYYLGTTVATVATFPTNVDSDSERYLVGVVEAEMNSNWPMEALKAQAIAARSYAYMNRDHLDNSPRTQAWVGPELQTDRARQAVAETRGQVVTFAGDVVPAYFHSTSGGWTENNENVWGGTPLPWLRGVASPWETDSPHWSWQTKSYSKQQMQDIVNHDPRTEVGELKTIKIVGRGVSGRVTSMQIIGSTGTKTVSGPTFKRVFSAYTPDEEHGLESTLFGFN